MTNIKRQFDAASALFGGTQPSASATVRVTATATEDSSDGVVNVVFEDGTDADIPVIGSISAGDEVVIDVQSGIGVGIGTVGWGDRMYTDVDGLTTLVHEYSGGVLVAKVGQSVGALVNASGEFDIVSLTWSGTTPTIGSTLAQFGQVVNITPVQGYASYPVSYNMTEYGFKIIDDTSSDTLFYVGYDINNQQEFLLGGGYAVHLDGSNIDQGIGTLTVTNNGSTDTVHLHEIVPVTYTTGSMAVGSGGNFTIPRSDIVSSYDYTPVGIVGWDSTHGQNWQIGRCHINSNGGISGSYKHGFGSAAESCTFIFYVLCMSS